MYIFDLLKYILCSKYTACIELEILNIAMVWLCDLNRRRFLMHRWYVQSYQHKKMYIKPFHCVFKQQKAGNELCTSVPFCDKCVWLIIASWNKLNCSSFIGEPGQCRQSGPQTSGQHDSSRWQPLNYQSGDGQSKSRPWWHGSKER